MEGKHVVVGKMMGTEGNVLQGEIIVGNDHDIDKISRGVGGTILSAVVLIANKNVDDKMITWSSPKEKSKMGRSGV